MQDEPFEKRWSMPGVYGSERAVMNEVASAILYLSPRERRLDDMLTAVAEAILNAIEHGNRSDHSLPVTLQLIAERTKYLFRIFDHGSGEPIILDETLPAAKWEAELPRGWGLFLICRLSDRVSFGRQEHSAYIEIVFYRREQQCHQQIEHQPRKGDR